jgi:hypothetical protein
MKLNRGLVVAMAMVVGSVAITGCSKSSDESAEPSDTATEQASVTGVDGANQAVASNDEGTTQYARFGHGGRGGGRGFGRAERGGRGRGEGRGERGHGRRHEWWRFW